MRWKRSRPLWPLLGALTILLALAVNAPRNWRRPMLDSAPQETWQLSDTEPWFETLFPPKEKSFEPYSSPVVAPALPPLEEDSYSLEDFDVAAVQSAQKLPLQSQYTLTRLFEIGDSLKALVGRIPEQCQRWETDEAPQAASIQRVQVNNLQDRLAMRNDLDRPRLRAPDPPDDISDKLEAFTDLLMDTVRRTRQGGKVPVQVAMQVPTLKKSAQEDAQVSTSHAHREGHEVASSEGPLLKETPPSQPLLRFRPESLIARLEAIPTDSPAADWAEQTLAQVRLLAEDTTTAKTDAPLIVARLETLAEASSREALQPGDPLQQHQWLRAVKAVECHVAIWRLLFDSNLESVLSARQEPNSHGTNFMQILGEIASRLAGDENGEPWREYLLLDQIAAAASEGASIDVRGRRKLAQEVLSRMTDRRLTVEQNRFVLTEPIVALEEALRPWAMGPVDFETLAALVERCETNSDLRYASALAQLMQRLRWSPVPEYQRLAEHLDQHYRGANMRITVTDDLINRMMPQQTTSMAPVNDRIAGAKVRGRSRTTTKVQVQLVPNDHAWQLALEAKGAVYSRTRSDTWPARVQNSAKMYYQARKMVLIDGQGLRVAPAKAHARGRNDLVAIDTEFDPIPIVSHLIRDAARRRHQKSRPIALKQVKGKVARKAKSRMDSEANPKLHRLEEKFQDNILASIEELALSAEPVEMYTNSERAVMKLRLANHWQLAANTLRPLAPSDSVASVQLHQSVLNNAVAGLGLNGKRMTLLELHSFISEKLGRPDAVPPEDLPTRAVVQFAPHDAVQINCQSDRLELVLNFREVKHGIDKIQSFAVHAHFRPLIDGLDVRLVRDGTLQFDGRNLRTGPRVVLHSVFGKLLPKGQHIPLLKRDLGSDPRLEGLMVTQLAIVDGWIGLALGPEFPGRTAWRTLSPWHLRK